MREEGPTLGAVEGDEREYVGRAGAVRGSGKSVDVVEEAAVLVNAKTSVRAHWKS